MRGVIWIVVVTLTASGMLGCNSNPSKRNLASTEPALIADDPDVAIVDRAKPVPRTASAVDRHPLLSKPRQYYDDTNSNKVAKTAAAAFIGVPAGIFGELKQIVVGVPQGASGTSY
jgi:hypothetical protein